MYKSYIKRLIDIVLSGVALIVLSPLFLILAVCVCFKLGRPVIFHQLRPGKNEKIFNLCKFRTMTDECDAQGQLLSDEQRLTPFGKMLRKTSLDELPELWNIFKGDMSIIGPRPLLVKYLPYYTKEERKRHSVRPGLTGLAQINGRNALGWEKRFEYDLQYVNHCTFLMDLSIVAKTVGKVLHHSDTLSGEEQTVEDFDKYRSK